MITRRKRIFLVMQPLSPSLTRYSAYAFSVTYSYVPRAFERQHSDMGHASTSVPNREYGVATRREVERQMTDDVSVFSKVANITFGLAQRRTQSEIALILSKIQDPRQKKKCSSRNRDEPTYTYSLLVPASRYHARLFLSPPPIPFHHCLSSSHRNNTGKPYSVVVPNTETENRGATRRCGLPECRQGPLLALNGAYTVYENFRRGVSVNPDGPCLGRREVDSRGVATPYVFETYRWDVRGGRRPT